MCPMSAPTPRIHLAVASPDQRVAIMRICTESYAAAATRTLQLFYPAMRDYPGGFAMMAIALDEHLAQPKTLVLRGRPEAIDAWKAELAREYLPDTLVLAIPKGVPGLPPVLDKPARSGEVNGWLCRGVSCLEPSTDLVHLRQILREKT